MSRIVIELADGSRLTPDQFRSKYKNVHFSGATPSSAYLKSIGASLVALPPTDAEIRAERDALLAATDWMALSDVTMSEAWATYRQALRDITSQEGFPASVDWPAKPE